MNAKIVKTFSTVVLITIFSKIIGLIRDIVFAYYFGTGYEATAFFTAIRIPTQLLDLGLSAAITATFIPVFNEVMQKKGKDNANSFASNFVNIIAIVTTLISVLGIIFAPQVVQVLAGGFDAKTFELTVQLIQITFPMIIFTAIAFSFVGFLQSYGQFNVPAMISAVSNIAIILFLIFFKDVFGIYGITVFMLIAWALQVIIQIPFVINKGYKFSFKIDFKNTDIKKVFKLALPIIISTSVIPINILVSTRIASGMGEDGVAILEYGYKLFIVAVGVFTYAIGNIIFPEFARLSSSNNMDDFIALIKKGLKAITFILIPFTIGFIIFRTDIVSILYEHGEFNSTSTLLTSNVLLYYAIGMIGFGFLEIMNKVFYAKQNVKTPVIVGLCMIVTNIILCIMLSSFMGINGLALATSITIILNALILMICANVQMKNILTRDFAISIFKILIASISMGIVVIVLNNWLIGIMNTDILQVIRLIIGAIVGVSVYVIVAYLMKLKEIEEFKNMIKIKRS